MRKRIYAHGNGAKDENDDKPNEKARVYASRDGVLESHGTCNQSKESAWCPKAQDIGRTVTNQAQEISYDSCQKKDEIVLSARVGVPKKIIYYKDKECIREDVDGSLVSRVNNDDGSEYWREPARRIDNRIVLNKEIDNRHTIDRKQTGDIAYEKAWHDENYQISSLFWEV